MPIKIQSTDCIMKISSFNLSSCVCHFTSFLGGKNTYLSDWYVSFEIFNFLHTLTCSYRDHTCICAKMGSCCIYYSVIFFFHLVYVWRPFHVTYLDLPKNVPLC